MPDTAQRLRETQQYWDTQADTFDQEPDHGLHDPGVLAAWTTLLTQALPFPPASVLDIGCGTGSISLLLARRGYNVTGIDLSEAMIARATAKTHAAGYDLPFRVMDAFTPSLSPRQFDVIVCRHLLWALPDPALALERWVALLVPGGRLVLIEGVWGTGAGLPSQQIVAALPALCPCVTVSNLSRQSALWGRDVTDERYLILADHVADSSGTWA
jgi:SAM-dependent methyltransferase